MSTSIAAGSLRPTGTRTIRLEAVGPVEITVQDRDRTRPFLLLHGGGVAIMAGFADLLAERTHARACCPPSPASPVPPAPRH